LVIFTKLITMHGHLNIKYSHTDCSDDCGYNETAFPHNSSAIFILEKHKIRCKKPSQERNERRLCYFAQALYVNYAPQLITRYVT